MLGFFRKHQKIFFVIVTFFIVISFSFFGTFSTFTDREEVQDHVVGHLIDGSALKESKLLGMVHLLEHGVKEGGQNANLLNNSMVHSDLILPGLGEIFAEHYFEKFQPELEMRWKRAKSYTPYSHPHAPYINARAVWAQYCPKILPLLDELKEAPQEFSQKQLSLLFKLYEAQAQFPAPFLHQVLYYQQMQNDQIRPDMGLPHANVALFGFQSIEDWFGVQFLEEMGKFILNTACVAREEGYSVKMEEAKIDLFSNFYRGLKEYPQGEELSAEEAHQYYMQQIQHIGLQETEAIALWREVMHFQRFFHEVGEGVFLDPLSFKQFKTFAKPSHQICRYRLPRALCFNKFRDMLKFQRYLEIVTESGQNILELSTVFRPAEGIMDAYPELVYKPFEVEIAYVTKLDAAARVSLKQTWQWEGVSENFVKLQHAFPSLAKSVPQDLNGRMQALDALDEMTRFKVDQFARLAFIDDHPEIIDELLAQAKREKQTLKVSLKEGDNPLSGAHFLALLEIEDRVLDRYSVDQETYASITVLDKGKGWHLLSFEEASREALLDHLLDELLLTAYTSMELKDPFEEVKDEVGAKVYADLIRSLKPAEDLDEVAHHRFDQYLQKMRALAIEDPDKFSQRQSSPWALEEFADQIALGENTFSVGEFSPVRGGGFYKLLEKNAVTASDSDIAMAKAYLKKDAEQELMRKMLNRL